MNRGILSKRGIVLLIALTLAGLGTFSIRAYVQGIEARTLQGAELVEAFVAKETIAAGTSGRDATSNGMIESQAIPRRLVADGSVVNLDDIQDRFAQVDIMAGEQILESRFSSKSESALSVAIPDDRQAFALEVDIPSGVAGFVEVGSRVSVIAHFDEPQPTARYLVQNIEVLAVGRHISPGKDDEVDVEKILLTLAVTPTEAEKLALAVIRGQVYLTLVPSTSEPISTPGRSLDDVFS